jgi:hypothetical protein
MRRFDRERYVCIADVWAASMLPGDLVDLVFDFIGEDGFRTSARCPPIEGAMLSYGYLHATRRDLRWDLDLPCAYRVRSVAMIVADEMRAETKLDSFLRLEEARR